ncbi:phosphotransferase [Rossellomorea aquimaris]|uniref:phosphotransferase enzyme family protein n=1 Tax=Rossellomorea aquimaris TaxID=189382 RepID=UPI001CD40418|nr:phosphotransferase [Rossellomorea aquimaris]MCA1054405.1 phosphotransferase [Rossellomorea aquimaris]
MMKLSTMKKVMDMVYSEKGESFINQILEHWGYDEESVSIVRLSSNVVFAFRREGERYFLRFNEVSERGYSKIESELKIITELAERGLNVAKPIPSLRRKVLEVIQTNIGVFHAVVFEALQGNQFDVEEMSDECIFLWGKELGRLHALLKQLPEDHREDCPSWTDLLIWAKNILPINEAAAHRECDRLLSLAGGLSMSNEHYGIIHYDFELDNVVFHDDSVGMLDFDDASVHWFAADVVYALRAVGDFDLENPIIKTFIEGYKSESSLDLDLISEHSLFERLHGVISLAKLIRAVDLNEEELPEWLDHLRVKLCGVIERYRLSIEKYDR